MPSRTTNATINITHPTNAKGLGREIDQIGESQVRHQTPLREALHEDVVA